MRISRSLLDQIIDHARRDAPNECCGVVLASDGTATTVQALENVHASPFRFEIDGKDLIPYAFAEDDGEALAAIYHSHTRSEAYPSQTDVGFSYGWPGIEWIIVGLAGAGEPEVRSYLIDDGEVREVPVEVS